MDYREELDYVDWGAVYAEKPDMQIVNEGPEDALSIDEQVAIMEDAEETIEKNRYYKDVKYDFIMLSCIIRNTSDNREYEMCVEELSYVVGYLLTEEELAGVNSLFLVCLF